MIWVFLLSLLLWATSHHILYGYFYGQDSLFISDFYSHWIQLAEFRYLFAVHNIKVVLCCSFVWKAGLELGYGSPFSRPKHIKSSFYLCVSWSIWYHDREKETSRTVKYLDLVCVNILNLKIYVYYFI